MSPPVFTVSVFKGLIVSIEKKTRIKLSVMAFQDNPTVLKLAEKIYMKITGSESGENEEINSVQQVILSHVDAEEREALKNMTGGDQ